MLDIEDLQSALTPSALLGAFILVSCAATITIWILKPRELSLSIAPAKNGDVSKMLKAGLAMVNIL